MELPSDAAFAARFKDAFTGALVEPRGLDGKPALFAATLFERLPIALLEPCST